MMIKPGVSLQGLQLPMRLVLIVAEEAYKSRGRELVVTSGTEGQHSARSLHYYGYALDFRIKGIPLDIIHSIVLTLRQELGDSYRVLLEATHIHVEYREVLGERN